MHWLPITSTTLEESTIFTVYERDPLTLYKEYTPLLELIKWNRYSCFTVHWHNARLHKTEKYATIWKRTRFLKRLQKLNLWIAVCFRKDFVKRAINRLNAQQQTHKFILVYRLQPIFCLLRVPLWAECLWIFKIDLKRSVCEHLDLARCFS